METGQRTTTLGERNRKWCLASSAVVSDLFWVRRASMGDAWCLPQRVALSMMDVGPCLD